MKTDIGTARHFLPPNTPSEVCHAFNRSALTATIAARAVALGLTADLSDIQMAGLAQLVRDTKRSRPLSAETRAAVRAALRPALSAQDDPDQVAAAVFSSLPGTPLRVRDTGGREYFLVAVPA
ncbi:hypothetical protein ABUW04_01335 [Streptacidiphilus sp. N1-10]|uniref:Uncharacterized protein n=1 Tax=Streptacidiphilus jeojiensis TaxID=3229225 RepID=A0ABV6XG27_9ACTN